MPPVRVVARSFVLIHSLYSFRMLSFDDTLTVTSGGQRVDVIPPGKTSTFDLLFFFSVHLTSKVIWLQNATMCLGDDARPYECSLS